jgi:glucosamine-6-phosphate isomerase
MLLKIYKDYHELSMHTATEVINLLTKKPGAVICLASGDTPRLTCELITKMALDKKTDISQCTFIGLDEWLGVPPENDGSCHYFFDSLLLKPLNFSPEQTHLFNALSKDTAGECRKMDNLILEKGGIDLMIVGVGMNGHIGFNEPGTSFENYSHVIDLDETTLSVGRKYFKDPVPLSQGITLGLKHLQQSKQVFLIANGVKKAGVIRQTLEGEISDLFPASIIRTHPHGVVMTDESAASLLSQQ